jgi:hypothetical protein
MADAWLRAAWSPVEHQRNSWPALPEVRGDAAAILKKLGVDLGEPQVLTVRNIKNR